MNVVSTKQLYDNIQDYQNIDLIISTVKFKETITIPNLVISAMLTFDDQERIHNMIEDLNHE